MEHRYFARAYWRYKGTTNKQDLPKDDPMIDLIRDMEFDSVRERLAQANG